MFRISEHREWVIMCGRRYTTPKHFNVQWEACQGKVLSSVQCGELLKLSEKALKQRDLELAFLEFEKKYSQILI